MEDDEGEWRVRPLGNHGAHPWLLVYHAEGAQWTGLVEAFGSFSPSGLKTGGAHWLAAPTKSELFALAEQWVRAKTLSTDATSPASIESDIVSHLQRAYRGLRDIGDGGWTSATYATLAELGRAQGHRAWHRGLPDLPGEGEWLYDLGWVKRRPPLSDDWQRDFDGLALACECEWRESNEEVLHDFYKLTVAVADLKLMVVTNRARGDAKARRALLEPLCPPNSGRYLLIAASNQPDHAFEHEAWPEVP